MSPIHPERRFQKTVLGKTSLENIFSALTCYLQLHANLSESSVADGPLTSVWVCPGLGLEGRKLLIEKQCLVQSHVSADKSFPEDRTQLILDLLIFLA